MKNILLVEVGGSYSFDLANAIEKRGLKVSHVTTSEPLHNLNTFLNGRDCKVLEAKNLYSSKILSKNFGSVFTLLTQDILKKFQDIERDFFILTDRSNSRPLSFRYRKNLFYDLIRFWLGYLKQEKIESIYFPYTPHAPWELVLMHAARYLEIPYCYLSHTAINNRSILRTTYKKLDKVPDDYLQDQSIPSLKASIKADLLEDYEEESIVTNVVKLQNDLFQKQVGINANTESYKNFYEKELQKQTVKKYLKKTKDVTRSALEYFKIKDPIFRFATAMDERRYFLGWEFLSLKHKHYVVSLRQKYDALSQKPDLSAKYIYFPLHLQPELTSQPEGGYFEDQYLAFEVLLASLPKGWKIYVKENPRQFDTAINRVSAMHFRDQADFEKFAQHPEVLIVPQNIKSEDLIKNAQTTATITGTAGWEALNLGKTCMTFGKPWYSPCQSCFVIESPEDVSAALKAIKVKTIKIVQADILRYLSYYQEYLFIGTLQAPSDVSYNSRSYNELIQNHSESIAKFFNPPLKGAKKKFLKRNNS